MQMDTHSLKVMLARFSSNTKPSQETAEKAEFLQMIPLLAPIAPSR